MKTRIIYTKFWKDDFVAELTPSEKLVFMYYLTNEKINILHLYECSDREVIFDTGVDSKTLQNAKEKLENAGKIYFYKSYVYLKNADRYEDYDTEPYQKAKSALLKQTSEDVIKWYQEKLTSQGVVGDQSETGQKTKDISNKHITGVVKGMEIITPEELQELQNKYPLLNVLEEFEAAKDWLAANGERKKDYQAFFRGWLRRAKPTNKKKGIIEI